MFCKYLVTYKSVDALKLHNVRNLPINKKLKERGRRLEKQKYKKIKFGQPCFSVINDSVKMYRILFLLCSRFTINMVKLQLCYLTGIEQQAPGSHTQTKADRGNMRCFGPLLPRVFAFLHLLSCTALEKTFFFFTFFFFYSTGWLFKNKKKISKI